VLLFINIGWFHFALTAVNKESRYYCKRKDSNTGNQREN